MSFDPLALISQDESGGQNVPNYEYSPAHTASGPYQINVSTWNDVVAPGTGLPTVSYPAGVMSLPISEQQQGAAYLYNTQGFAPWAPYNPTLASDIQAAGGAAAFPQPGAYQPDLTASEAPSDFTTGSTGDLSGFAGNQDFTGSYPASGGSGYFTGDNTGTGLTYTDPYGNTSAAGGTVTPQQANAGGGFGAAGASISTWWENLVANVENLAERAGVFFLGGLLVVVALWVMMSHTETAQHIRRGAARIAEAAA